MSNGSISLLGNSLQISLEQIPFLSDQLELRLEQSDAALLVVELFTSDGGERCGRVDHTVPVSLPGVSPSSGFTHPAVSQIMMILI